VWYDESGTGMMVAFDPRGGAMQTVTIPTPGAIVRNISVDSTRGRIWLALSGTSRLGKIELATRLGLTSPVERVQ
jgi:streptogramin lyase